MTAIRHIRKNVLKVSQATLASIVGTTQATVSRWEAGELSPNLTELEAIRAEAKRREIDWNDELFFAAPEPVAA